MTPVRTWSLLALSFPKWPVEESLYALSSVPELVEGCRNVEMPVYRDPFDTHPLRSVPAIVLIHLLGLADFSAFMVSIASAFALLPVPLEPKSILLVVGPYPCSSVTIRVSDDPGAVPFSMIIGTEGGDDVVSTRSCNVTVECQDMFPTVKSVLAFWA